MMAREDGDIRIAEPNQHQVIMSKPHEVHQEEVVPSDTHLLKTSTEEIVSG